MSICLNFIYLYNYRIIQQLYEYREYSSFDLIERELNKNRLIVTKKKSQINRSIKDNSLIDLFLVRVRGMLLSYSVLHA